jgi:hypothetical protein
MLSADPYAFGPQAGVIDLLAGDVDAGHPQTHAATVMSNAVLARRVAVLEQELANVQLAQQEAWLL